MRGSVLLLFVRGLQQSSADLLGGERGAAGRTSLSIRSRARCERDVLPHPRAPRPSPSRPTTASRRRQSLPPIAIVVSSPPVFTADTPPTTATVGLPYSSYSFAASGYPTPIYSVASGALPAGLTLDPVVGTLRGRRPPRAPRPSPSRPTTVSRRRQCRRRSSS